MYVPPTPFAVKAKLLVRHEIVELGTEILTPTVVFVVIVMTD